MTGKTWTPDTFLETVWPQTGVGTDGMAARTLGLLRRSGVRTVGDLLRLTRTDVAVHIRNSGARCADYVEDLLASHGLKLAFDSPVASSRCVFLPSGDARSVVKALISAAATAESYWDTNEYRRIAGWIAAEACDENLAAQCR